MATTLYLTRTIGGQLKPADAESQEALYEMPFDRAIKATLSLPRNYKRLKWWWKLCEIISENGEHWPSKDAASDMLKLKCGLFRIVIVPGKEPGEWVQQYQAGSIAFGSMEEPDFKALCNKAVQVASEVLACQSDDLWEALNEFFTERSPQGAV